MEIVRRIILTIGVLVGLWLLVQVPSTLYRVDPIDWSAKRIEKQGRAQSNLEIMGGEVPAEDLKGIDLAPKTRGSLADFIQSETKGDLIQVSGDEWEGFFNAVAFPSEQIRARHGRSLWSGSLYFSSQDGPLGQIAEKFGKGTQFKYVAISGGSRTEYLAVIQLKGNDVSSQPPFELVYPKRHLGWTVLLATLLLYTFLPHRKVSRESLHYSTARGGVLPDLIASVLGGMFFVLPYFITNENAGGDGVFSPGWCYVTGALWFLGLIIATLLPIGAWYSSLSLEVVQDHLMFTNIREQFEFSTSDIEAVSFGRIDSPKLSRILFWAAILTGGGALPAVLMNSGPRYALRLSLRGGRNLKFATTGLIGLHQMVGWLRRQGVQISREIYEFLNSEPNDPIFDQPFPAPGKGFGMVFALLLFGSPLAYAWVLSKPGPLLAITPAKFGTKTYVKPTSHDWVPSRELMQKEDQLMGEMTKVKAQIDRLEARLKSAPPSERRAIMSESDKLSARMQQIFEEYNQARKNAGAKD